MLIFLKTFFNASDILIKVLENFLFYWQLISHYTFMQEQVERFSLLSSLQGIVPPPCRQQSCSLSSFAALSGCFQNRMRRS